MSKRGADAKKISRRYAQTIFSLSVWDKALVGAVVASTGRRVEDSEPAERVVESVIAAVVVDSVDASVTPAAAMLAAVVVSTLHALALTKNGTVAGSFEVTAAKHWVKTG